MFAMRRFAVVRRTAVVCKLAVMVPMRPQCVVESSGASDDQITTNRDHAGRPLFMMFMRYI